VLPLDLHRRADQAVRARLPALGEDMDVVDAEGARVRGEVGELVCRGRGRG
jgi:hypothetical protein